MIPADERYEDAWSEYLHRPEGYGHRQDRDEVGAVKVEPKQDGSEKPVSRLRHKQAGRVAQKDDKTNKRILFQRVLAATGYSIDPRKVEEVLSERRVLGEAYDQLYGEKIG